MSDPAIAKITELLEKKQIFNYKVMKDYPLDFQDLIRQGVP